MDGGGVAPRVGGTVYAVSEVASRRDGKWIIAGESCVYGLVVSSVRGRHEFGAATTGDAERESYRFRRSIETGQWQMASAGGDDWEETRIAFSDAWSFSDGCAALTAQNGDVVVRLNERGRYFNCCVI